MFNLRMICSTNQEEKIGKMMCPPMETVNLYKNRDAMRSKQPRLFGRDNELSPRIESI